MHSLADSLKAGPNMKRWGCMSNEDICDWEELPLNRAVLTSVQFGSWLGRRDDAILRRILGKVKTELEIRYDVENNPSDRCKISAAIEEVLKSELKGREI